MIENLRSSWRLLVLVTLAIVANGGSARADGSLLEAAARSKKTGLPMFVTFGGPSCPHCVAMKKRLKEEPELNKLISTQYVYIETAASGTEAKQFQDHYKIEVKGIPHTVIVSAKGELITESKGAPQGDGLLKLLQEGIEKTGGMKDLAAANPQKTNKGKLSKEELEVVLKQVADAKDKIGSEETSLDAMVTLLSLSRAHAKASEVKKEITPIFAEVNKDKVQAAVLGQARMLDSAAAAIDAKKAKLAENTYKSVIKKYPESAAAKYAQAKLDALASGEASAPAEETKETKPTSTEENAAVASKAGKKAG